MQDRFVPSIAHLPPLLAQALVPLLDSDFSGHFEAKQIETLKRISGLEENQLLEALLPVAAALATPTISEFYVGAIAKGTSGDIYMGANMELKDEVLGHTVHAEQSAISHAWLKGEKSITDIVVNYSPCGHCRQFMNELVDGCNIHIHLPDQPTQRLSHYLPYSFGPKDLNVTEPLLASKAIQLKLVSEDPVILEATHQANKSYAPYTGTYAAITFELDDGSLFSGRYAENAAFNPSMMPTQMALTNLLRHNRQASEIVRAVLVESASGKISLANASLDALHTLTSVELEHLVVELE
ncbi:cytidine deaminase [Parashewanella spongiae]|uniref:Cytidine deaminase n=1 Tax=Parashewanella spongiae TaxID=342950 RepID=A0A3A6TZN6_9GAMM|nr:cytidine deaminase [Parashewanella spongiae]MCL1078165.1 cytidine deaminase [Parashewanella spongiae]RJY14898.1 cytidine deaminase [Parashewanella spongiae]